MSGYKEFWRRQSWLAFHSRRGGPIVFITRPFIGSHRADACIHRMSPTARPPSWSSVNNDPVVAESLRPSGVASNGTKSAERHFLRLSFKLHEQPENVMIWINLKRYYAAYSMRWKYLQIRREIQANANNSKMWILPYP